MNTWSTVIAQLATTPSDAHAQTEAHRKAQGMVSKEFRTVKQQFEHSETQLKELEQNYSAAKQALTELEHQTKQIEADTQHALAREEAKKALALASEIAKLNVNVCGNRKQVLALEQTMHALKGTLSQNRYNLFRLEQQLDTLNASAQLQRAQSQLSAGKGIRTALHSIARLNAQAKHSAPQKPQTAHPAAEAQAESAEQILNRLRAVK
ncbi:MAG TPA: hypothetical protein VIC26_09015 [Marinagarivorans sp.]